MDRARYLTLLETAIVEARRGLAEGGIPIGAALFDNAGKLLGSGHNRRVQDGDPPRMARPMRFAKRGGSAAIATKSWSRRLRHAGIAVG